MYRLLLCIMMLVALLLCSCRSQDDFERDALLKEAFRALEKGNSIPVWRNVTTAKVKSPNRMWQYVVKDQSVLASISDLLNTMDELGWEFVGCQSHTRYIFRKRY